MKTLTSLSTSAFANCTINEFDAPNINSITVVVVDDDDDDDDDESITFTVGKKNFHDSPGIKINADCPIEEPNYEELIFGFIHRSKVFNSW